MRNDKTKIIEVLRQRLEHTEPDTNCSQWLLGAVVSTQPTGAAAGSLNTATYKVRVIVKTSTSPYVDGMDIFFFVAEGKFTRIVVCVG